MSGRSHNTQMFALRQSPPGTIALGGAEYRLVRVFKHDFFAATCLYEVDESTGSKACATNAASGTPVLPKIVVKFGRENDFCGLPLGWYAEMLRRHEEAIYRLLAGIPGVPRWVGSPGPSAYAIEYIDARPLDHLPVPPAGFFERLREIFDAIHARGVAYCDGNKRSNILVDAAGRPFLIDYQIAVRRRDDWPWPLRSLVGAAVAYLGGKDIYHLYKHKRRLLPGELTADEEALSRQRGPLHRFHRKFTKIYRAIRRPFLREQHRKGSLVSPTASLEDHHQPEKETWRQD